MQVYHITYMDSEEAIFKNCFDGDLWSFTRKISAKSTNVAIKRVKSNAPALALSSDSNIDEVNHAKVSKNTLLFILNVEFLEVAKTYYIVDFVCEIKKNKIFYAFNILFLLEVRF